MAGAGTIVKSISPALSAIPFVGGILSGVGTAVGGALEASEAENQAAEAEKIRAEALKTKPQGIQKEYLQNLNMKKMAAISGLPALEEAKLAFEAKTANNARAIRESSPTGAATLAAMSAAQGLENNSIQELMGKNSIYKADALTELGDTVKGIGGEKQALQNAANLVRKEGLQAASAFDAASTYNKMGGINKILGSATSTLSSLFKNADGSTNEAALKKAISDYMAQNGGNVPYNESNPLDPSKYQMQLGQSATDFSIPNNKLGADMSISNVAASPFALKSWK